MGGELTDRGPRTIRDLRINYARWKQQANVMLAFRQSWATESAFWLTFNRLSAEQRADLCEMTGAGDEFTAFSRVCRIYKVRAA